MAVPHPWTWTPSRATKVEKEKVAKARRNTTTRTRTWSATCAKRKATARALAGTPRRMAALANLQSPRILVGAKGTKGKKGGKGKGGKGKGKAHSFEGEGEEEQEWPEGDGQDREQAGDGDLGFLCVLGPSAAQFEAWDRESKGNNYVRPAMPSVVGQWAHIVGAEPTWIYLPEEPDYSKQVETRKPDSSSSHNPESEESEEETVEVEEADEEEQHSPSAEESSGRGRGRDPRKGTPAKVGSSKKPSSSTSPSARKRKEPLRAATPAPSRSPKPLYLPPHKRELKAKANKPLPYDPRRQGRRLNLNGLLRRSVAVRNLLSLSGRLRNVGDARAPLYRDGPWSRRRPRRSAGALD